MPVLTRQKQGRSLVRGNREISGQTVRLAKGVQFGRWEPCQINVKGSDHGNNVLHAVTKLCKVYKKIFCQ